MHNRLRKLIGTVLLVGTIIGSTSALSYAAGFWNYTPYTLTFLFTPEGCPWVLRPACLDVYTLPPFQNGIPGSMSSNNTAGTVEIGGWDSNLLVDENRRVYYSGQKRVIEVGPQDYIAFALEGKDLKMRIRRSDTGIDEYEEIKITNM